MNSGIVKGWYLVFVDIVWMCLRWKMYMVGITGGFNKYCCDQYRVGLGLHPTSYSHSKCVYGM